MTPARPLTRLPVLAVGALSFAFAWLCVRFVAQPSLGTFADDSVSYLVMAQAFSPWEPASPAVREALRWEGFYPPLFPLLLAVVGAAHDFSRAHAVSALLVAACVPLTYALGRCWLQGAWAAAIAAAVVALLPAMWVNAFGILSEPLYCVLLLAALYAIETRRGDWLVGVLFCALVLTRAAGLVLALAYAVWCVTRPALPGIASRARAAAPAAAALVAYIAWIVMRPGAVADDYARILAERAGDWLNPASAVALLARQARALAEGWAGSILLFWVDGRPGRVLMAGAAGSLALSGMVLRIRSGRPDGWIAAGYLMTFLAWPFYDQMGRFVFPAIPVFVLYAFLAAGAAARRVGRSPSLGYGLVSLLVASLAIPGLAFIHQRAGASGPQGRIVDWYRTPDLAAAHARAETHLGLFEDMAAIRAHTPAAARVMWVAPGYVALLADRHGMHAPPSRLTPEAWRSAVRASGADYVLVTLYHPRDTLSSAAWQVGVQALLGHAKLVRSNAASDTRVTSMLFELR